MSVPPHEHARDHLHDHAHGEPIAADASVRLAGPNDAPAVGIVQAAVWREAYADVLAPEVLDAFEPNAFAKVWRESLTNPPAGAYRLLVACAGPQVVGFLALGPSQDPDTGQATAEVLALGVHPEARRVGHGSRLLNAAVDIARELGAEALSAWLLAGDESTRAFLLVSGLEPDGAYRDRVIGPDDRTAREVRVSAWLTDPEAADG